MPRFKPNELVVVNMYLRRPTLIEEHVGGILIRVAMRVIDRVYASVESRISEEDFPDHMLTSLKKRRSAGRPHMLEESLIDVLHGWKAGERYADTYARVCHNRAQRVVRKLKYGGRRG